MRFLSSLALLAASAASAATVTVHVDQPGAAINPAMWGVFFEDINFGADGGLYAELVKNRGFEFPDALMGWIKLMPPKAKGEVTVRDDAPFNPKNPHFVRITSDGTAPMGVANEGFRGIGVRKGEAYNLSLRVRNVSGSAKLRVLLYSSDGAVLVNHEFTGLAGEWTELSAKLQPSETDAKASLALVLADKGTVDLDFVSLFPDKTWKNRRGGLRADMVQALADMHPGFVRFPGGCIVEGATLGLRYEWKKTLGPVEERPLLLNRWNNEFSQRATPDYYQSFGLGFFEYFQLCEDIGAQPLPILNCGMACQFNSGELCPLDQLDPYIQDVIDLIEFANGPVTSAWGAKRAAMGHPEPFHLTMLGVGNEQWGETYFERFQKFAAVLKAKHPEITLIAAAGPDPADKRFKDAWAKLPQLGADVIDEHSYAKPEWFLDGAYRYDRYDRKGPKVFMGEYAAHDPGRGLPRNTFRSALAEAAFMTGLERNADVVRMASYAPLFANREAWQWAPDLIWVDGLKVVHTPNYYVQKLFATNRGDRVLNVKIDGAAGEETTRFFASSSYEESTGTAIVKLVNATSAELTQTLTFAGGSKLGAGTLTRFASARLEAINSFEAPESVVPETVSFAPSAPSFELKVPANSFIVLRVPVK